RETMRSFPRETTLLDEARQRDAEGRLVDAEAANGRHVVVAVHPDEVRHGAVPGDPGGHCLGGRGVEPFRVAFGDREQQRDVGFDQAGQRRVHRVGHAVVRVRRGAGRGGPRGVDAGDQRDAAHARKVAAVAGREVGDVRRARRVAHDDDPVGVAAVLGDVLAEPADRRGDVLRARRPFHLGGVAVGDVHADPAVPDRPGAHHVVGRGARVVLVARHEPAAVHKHEDRHRVVGGAVAGRLAGRVHVEAVPLVLAVAEVADDPRRGVAELLVERREQRPRGLREFRGDRCVKRAQPRDYVLGQLLDHDLEPKSADAGAAIGQMTTLGPGNCAVAEEAESVRDKDFDSAERVRSSPAAPPVFDPGLIRFVQSRRMEGTRAMLAEFVAGLEPGHDAAPATTPDDLAALGAGLTPRAVGWAVALGRRCSDATRVSQGEHAAQLTEEDTRQAIEGSMLGLLRRLGGDSSGAVLNEWQLTLARTMARLDWPYERYVLGLRLAQDMALEALLDRAVRWSRPDDRPSLLLAVTHGVAGYFDDSVRLVIAEFVAERQRAIAQSAAERRRLVAALIAGEQVPAEVAAAALGTDLAQHHLALLLWGAGPAGGRDDAAGWSTGQLELTAGRAAGRLRAPA